MSIEKEILKVTKIKPKAKESRQELLERVTNVVMDLSDDDWNTMSEEAQSWCNAATAAVNTEQEIPDFSEAVAEEKPAKKSAKKAAKKAAKEEVEEEEEEFEEEEDEDLEESEEEETDDSDEDEEGEDEEAEEEEAEEEEEEAPKSKKAPKKEKAEKAEKPAKKEKKAPKKEKVEKEPKLSGVTRIRELVLQNPESPAAEIDKIIRKEGFDVSEATVKANHADVHKTLKIMKRLGIFDINA